LNEQSDYSNNHDRLTNIEDLYEEAAT